MMNSSLEQSKIHNDISQSKLNLDNSKLNLDNSKLNQ